MASSRSSEEEEDFKTRGNRKIYSMEVVEVEEEAGEASEEEIQPGKKDPKEH